MVTARLILAPLLALITGRSWQAALGWRRLPVMGDIQQDPKREHFVRARIEGGLAFVLSFQDSAMQKPLADADLLIRASTLEKGKDGRLSALCLDF
jgi:molybdopterin molybdotransferase